MLLLHVNRGFEFGALDQPEEEEGHNFVNTALETIAADDEQPHSKVPKLKKKTGHFSPTNPKDDETENDPENSTSGGYNFNSKIPKLVAIIIPQTQICRVGKLIKTNSLFSIL